MGTGTYEVRLWWPLNTLILTLFVLFVAVLSFGAALSSCVGCVGYTMDVFSTTHNPATIATLQQSTSTMQLPSQLHIGAHSYPPTSIGPQLQPIWGMQHPPVSPHGYYHPSPDILQQLSQQGFQPPTSPATPPGIIAAQMPTMTTSSPAGGMRLRQAPIIWTTKAVYWLWHLRPTSPKHCTSHS